MIIRKTRIQTEEVELSANEDGKRLSQITKDFKSGVGDDDLNTLVFLVEQYKTHDVFYSVNFSLDDYNKNEVYRDIFIGCHIIDHTDQENLLIEVESEHEANYPFADELYKQLEDFPCTTLFELVHRQGFRNYYSNGFRAADRTSFEADIKLLK